MRPLRGITVVTLEHAVAAPFATRQLADLGARGIKIERPGAGDFARGYDDRAGGLSAHSVWTTRSMDGPPLVVTELASQLARLRLRRRTPRIGGPISAPGA